MFKNIKISRLLVLFFLFNLTQFLNAQYNFKNISSEDGLSSNSINAIFRDKKGFLWVGTNFGLNRYDGYTVKNFYQNPQDETSLKNNYINTIDEDYEGLLWINTRGGVLLFDPEKGSFLHNYQIILEKRKISKEGLSHVMNRDFLSGYIVQDSLVYVYNHENKQLRRISFSNKNLLYGAFDKHLNTWLIDDQFNIYKINKEDGNVIGIFTFPFQKKSYKDAYIYIDSDNGLWIILDKKTLFYYNTSIDIWHNFAKKEFANYPITSVTQLDNQICVGTDHGGIYYINKSDFSISNVKHGLNGMSLSDNVITSMYTDTENTMWVGTYKFGVNYTHSSFSLFNTQKVSEKDDENDVNCFVEDYNGNIWIGTNIGKLYIKSVGGAEKEVPFNKSKNSAIVSLCFDKKNRLWIGTYLDGLYCYDQGKVKHYIPSNSNIDNSVWSLAIDRNGLLWVGTLNKGLFYFDETLSDFIKAPCNDELGLTIECLFINRQNQLVVGGSYGFFILTNQGEMKEHVLFNQPADRIPEKNYINYISQDNNGYYWVCTQGGLAVYDKQLKKYCFLKKKDGIGQEFVYVSLVDANNDIWVSSSTGLFRIHVNDYRNMDDLNVSIESFSKENGLQDNVFNKKSGIITKSKDIVYFGGVKGYNMISPGSLKKNKIFQNLQFTNLYINNVEVEAGKLINERVLLNESISYCKRLMLKYNENDIRIRFSSLHLLSPQRCRYEYKLEGGDDIWYSLLGKDPYVIYNNLNPGSYKLIVRSIDLSNENSTVEKALLINVSPPFWLTWQAYSLYFVLFIFIVQFIIRSIVRQATLHLKLQKEQAEKEYIEQLSNMKVSFFTNLSHELRTPVSLIISPIETIIAKDPEGTEKNNLKMVLRNAKRLLFIVNQLLDFRKIEVGQVSFNPFYGDIVAFIKETAESFNDLAQNKSVDFSFETNIKELYMNFDPSKMERIIFNLLSNAFKFTLNNGYVKVTIEYTEGEDNPLLLKVEDSGIGIEQKVIDNIFNPFYQAENQKNLLSLGTGIGLSVVKSFVELHQGTIEVSSLIGKGTTFSLYFKVGKEFEISYMDNCEEINLFKHSPITICPKDKSLLIADDNDDFRFYLRENLKGKYNIIEAENGLIAYDKILRFIPDIIVADIMMPLMSGTELCEKAKNDPRISHIPILLLTADSSEKCKIDSYRKGADAYLNKPCSVIVLEARISNLLLKQVEMQVIIANNPKKETIQSLAMNSLDDKILQDVIRITEQCMGDEDFSISKLSKEVGMSAVYLNKKISSLTGKTTSEYVRYLRMKKACFLLSKTQKTISEIAYEIGYSMPKYFSKHFKEEFGVLPSEYRKNIY